MTVRALEPFDRACTTAAPRGSHWTRTPEIAHWLALVAIAALVALTPAQVSAQTTKKPTNAAEDSMPATPEVQAVIDAHPDQNLVICLAGCGNAQRARITSALPAPPPAPPSADDKGPTTPVSTTGGSLATGDTTMLPCVAGCRK